MNRITAALHRVLDFLRQCHGWVAVILAPALAVHAGLAEPDVIVWGTVSIQGTPVTARRTDVVLEARDTASGAILASYRMGTLPAAADHFVLRIPVQATVPLPADPLAASLGSTTVRIQVATALQLLGQQPVAVPARGQFQRLDIALSQGADANDLPDEWENAYFGSTGQNPDADPDVDGLTTREEFEAGTDPVRPDEPPNLGISRIEGRSAITFEARAASGPGYAACSAATHWSLLPKCQVRRPTGHLNRQSTICREPANRCRSPLSLPIIHASSGFACDLPALNDRKG
jgi:hypothetical protein